MKPVIVETYVRNLSKLRMSPEYLKALSLKVQDLVKEHERRAEGNGRSTLLARDI